MTFLHKLAKRLARFRAPVVVAVAATLACELPIADPLGALARLLLAPKVSTLRAGQVTQFFAVGLGTAGDTVPVTTRWQATGGTIVDTGTNGGKHYVSYMSPNQPGQYQVISLSASANVADTALVQVLAAPVASVSVSPASANFTPGQSLQFGASLLDANGAALTGRVVTWASSNTAVATVNGTGLVTAVAGGTATITATSEGINGTATASVTQTAAPVASVSVTPASPTVALGQTVQLVATPRDAGGTALAGRIVTWGSSNPAVALVGGNGLVTAVAMGTATISATSEGKTGTATVSVTQPVASMSVAPASASVTAGQTVQLTATPRDANGTALTGRVITWGSNNTAVATVNGSGLVTSLAAGVALITATSEGKSASSAITVNPPPVATVSVSPASASLTTGQTVQLTAILRDASGNTLSGRVVTWVSTNTGVATVNASGRATAIGAGSATITATSEGQSGGSAVTVTVAPVASVSVSPPSASVSVGQTIQLAATPRDASGNALAGRVVTWASSNTGVATVSGSGVVNGVAVGSATITASSEGQSGSSALTVVAAPPPGAWPHEPAGYTVLSNVDFSVPLPGNGTGIPYTQGWEVNNSGDMSIVTDITPFGTSSVLSMNYDIGFGVGYGPGNMGRSITPYQGYFLGFWWKASNPWQFHTGSNTNKIVFLSAGGQTCYLNMTGGQTIYVHNFQNDQHYLPNVNTTVVALGVWHQIEIDFRRSGILRVWVDGVLNLDYTNVPTPTWEDLNINPTWGGAGAPTNKIENDYFRYDNVHFSVP